MPNLDTAPAMAEIGPAQPNLFHFIYYMDTPVDITGYVLRKWYNILKS